MSLLNKFICRYNVQQILKGKSFYRVIGCKRYILSDAYYCNDEWNQRLQSPLLQNLNIDNLYDELNKRFGLKKKVSCVDIDVFVNSINSADVFMELESLLSRFRKTTATVRTLESTHTAVIRLFVQFGHADVLLKILQNRVAYGIFPDSFCYNILMDHFIEQKQFTEAAKVATLMMLQEEYDNKISKILGLYSCHMHLREPSSTWYPKDELESGEGKEDDDEEVFVRVPFLRNPHFDDHFDLVKPEHLIGKTLHRIGKTLENPVGKSYLLLGLGLHQKWKEAENVLDDILKSSQTNMIYGEAISRLKKLIDPVEGEDETNKLKADIMEKLTNVESSNKLADGDLHEQITELLKSIGQYEAEDIEAQKVILKGYEEIRMKNLEIEMKELRRKEFQQYADSKRKELKEKEDLLFFFENWNTTKLELDEIEEEEKKNKDMVKSEVEEYVPPEVRKSQA